MTLLARSSSGEPYDVQFLQASGSNCVRVFCHCAAGQFQQMCKHKLALINGDVEMLFDKSQAQELREVLAWPAEVRVLMLDRNRAVKA